MLIIQLAIRSTDFMPDPLLSALRLLSSLSAPPEYTSLSLVDRQEN